MTEHVERMMNLSRLERLGAAAVALCALPLLGVFAGAAALDEWASPKGRRRRARIERRRLRREARP
jgi:hypothetical protein